MKLKKFLPYAAAAMCLSAFLLLMIHSTGRITVNTSAVPRTAPVRVLIDPGHGGEDGGAVCDGVTEQGINLAISRDTADLLKLFGFDVSMTRDSDAAVTDEGRDIKQRKNNDMKARLRMYNSTANQAVISIHQNKFSGSSPHGAQVFYSPNHENSAVLAEKLRFSITSMLQSDNARECKAAGKEIYLLKNAQCPAVLVECGFLSNSAERGKLITDGYQKQMALAVATGFINYCNTK